MILVDLDNVVYDWARAMAQWLVDNGMLRDVADAMERYTQWSIWEDWDIPKGEFIRWWRLGIEAGAIYGEGPVISGAREALWQLSDAEWDIHIATSRLTKFGLHDKIIENTARWLRNNNIPYRNCHFTDDKLAISGAAIVDDRLDNMDVRVHGRAFLFPANHNIEPYELFADGTMTCYVGPYRQKGAWDAIVEALS